MVRIGLRFRQARKALGVALQDVANACGVTRQAVSLWETGKTVPNDGTLARAAEYLGVSRRWLLTGELPQRAEPPGTARPDAERAPAPPR